ncbi:ATP-grasp domain-containing protein [Acetivibrio straminisolvens]|uniref:ATP-grasp domain-containing protein n=1 Tax=Acetivibrio straminisolvens TaxID=253314 RepID=UPI002240A99A|nr:ATP-grasp domain-containing protein [Acetivibrio straminisolvens]
MNTCIGLIAGHSGDSLTDILKRKGYRVAIVGGVKNEPGMDKADFELVEDLSNYKEIIGFFREHEVNKVIIGTGHHKAILLADVLEKSGIKTNINYSKSLLAKDKIKFKEELIKLEIATPKYLSIDVNKDVSIDEITGKIAIPCVVKSSVDAIQPVKANSVAELKEAIEKVKATNTVVLIEEYIKGNDCTVAVESNGKNIRSLGVTYYCKAKEYRLKGFDGAYSRKMSEDKESEICKIAVEIAKQLGFTGLLRIDFIVDECSEKVYVLELNTVIVTGYKGSAYPFFKKQGIDIAEVMISNSLKLLGLET